MSAPAVPRITEADVLGWLHARYPDRDRDLHGNGQRWVYATHVRSHPGFYATREADAVAVDLWPSNRNAVHGHEVKVSRADWLAELRQPEKHVPVARYCDYWWLVVPERRIALPDELPTGWGMILAGPDGTRVLKSAPRRDPEPMPRGFVACMMRAAVKTERRRNERAVGVR